MTRERDYAKLHAAAYHFARFSRKAGEIADSVGIATRQSVNMRTIPNGTVPLMCLVTPVKENLREDRAETQHARKARLMTAHARYTSNS